MTPKEKASEFIVNYQLQCKSLDYQQAQICALIAVDEILNVLSEYTIEPFVFDIEYWKEVKQEIINL